MRAKKVRFNKTDIASICGIDPRNLEDYLSEQVKKQVEWKSGKCYFKDINVFEILKDIYPLKEDAEIKSLIKY